MRHTSIVRWLPSAFSLLVLFFLLLPPHLFHLMRIRLPRIHTSDFMIEVILPILDHRPHVLDKGLHLRITPLSTILALYHQTAFLLNI